VLRTRQVFTLLTLKCASRHNGVQFFISHLATWLCTRRFSGLLFDSPEPQIIGKTRCFATFLPFRAPGSSFFGDFLFFDLLSSSLLFSDSSHLCFSSVHIVRSLTSELPSPKLAQGTPQYYLYYKACARHFPVLFCNTKLAQGTSQYYFVLQSLQRINPSTTLYHKACTRHFPVLLCLQSLHKVVLHSLHKALPSITLYYKACTRHFRVLLFVLQSLHNELPQCTKYCACDAKCAFTRAQCKH